MKIVSKPSGRLARLGLTAAALLFAQQAMAIGTDPGIGVDNTAIVSYSVGGNVQPDETSNTVTFVVDRRINFTVVRQGIALTPVTAGDTQVYVEYLVQNLSNGDLPFNFDFNQLTSGDGDIYAGFPDTDIDMDTVSVHVAQTSNAVEGSALPPDNTDPATFPGNVPEDHYFRVRLYADAPDVAPNNSVAGLELLVTAVDPLTSNPALESLTWTEGAVDNVFAFAGTPVGPETHAIARDRDGFLIQSATLSVVKSQAVISGPFGGDRALPGARIEYTITISNTGTAGATSISIADDIDVDVTFVTDAYNGNASNVVFDAGTGSESFCLADDAIDTNSDGCTWDGTTLTIGGRDQTAGPIVPIDVGAGSTVTINFVVEIPAT